MLCPAKTIAILVMGIMVFIFGFNIDTSTWKTKIFGEGRMGQIKYYIFLAILIIFHFELFTNGYLIKNFLGIKITSSEENDDNDDLNENGVLGEVGNSTDSGNL